MQSTVTRGAIAAAVALLACMSLWTAHSFAATATNVEAAVESWYQVSPAEVGSEDPTCTLPIGCAPQPSAPVQPYPEDTLHVGIAAGRDTARTFLMLDVADLPTGAFITGGTLTLPVLTDQESGSMEPETAELMACSVLGPVKKARGGPAGDQPDFSCDTAAKATYKAGEKPTVTVDLKPLAATLATGGVAIVPAKAARDAGATWHVAFPAREHDAKEQIAATLQYDEAPAFGPVLPPPPPPEDSSSPSLSGGSVAGGFDDPGGVTAPEAAGSFEGSSPSLAGQSAPPATAGAGAAKAPAVAGAAAAPAAAPSMVPASFYSYPGVWLAPLALAGIAGLLARCLAGEIELPIPPPAGTPAVPVEATLYERLVEAFWPSRGAGPPINT